MRRSSISEAGAIGHDGRLRLPMDRLNAAFAEHAGERVVIRFYFDVPGSTASQRTYYYQYIIPTIKDKLLEMGERRSDGAIDRWLVAQFPGDKEETELGTSEVVTEARSLNMLQMSEFLEWLQQFAAENLQVYIEDPKVL